MIKGNYTPSRIVILGAIGVMCAMTWTVIGTVASVVVLVFMVDQIVFGGCGGKWLYRKVMLRQPFIIYIEPRKTAEQKVVLASSQESQCFNITLEMRVETRVITIAIKFIGSGIHPEIRKLYNWEWGIDRELIDIYTYPVPAKDCWYWQYKSSWLRHKGSKITIGVECLANSQYKGEVEASITAENTTGDIRLPLEVATHEKAN